MRRKLLKFWGELTIKKGIEKLLRFSIIIKKFGNLFGFSLYQNILKPPRQFVNMSHKDSVKKQQSFFSFFQHWPILFNQQIKWKYFQNWYFCLLFNCWLTFVIAKRWLCSKDQSTCQIQVNIFLVMIQVFLVWIFYKS